MAGSDGNRTFTFQDIRISTNTGYGVRMYHGGGDGDSSVTFRDTQLNDIRGTGIDINNGLNGNSTYIFQRVGVSDSSDGIDVYNSGVTGTFTSIFQDVIVKNVGHGSSGIGIHSEHQDLVGTFENIKVSNIGYNGIQVTANGSGGSSVTFRDVQVADVGFTGIRRIIKVGDHSTTFDDVQVSNTSSYGVILNKYADSKHNVTFNDVEFFGQIHSSSTSGSLISFWTDDGPLSANGVITNHATNNPALCRGVFAGTLTFNNGTSTEITDGVECVP